MDDFETFRKSLHEMILGIGAKVVDLAAEGKDALEMCKRTPYDVILMDFNLGKGKNGQQILEELHICKLLKHSTIFIMTTAEVDKEMVLSALEYQPDAYLAKPFSSSELKNRLDKAITKNEQLDDILSALDKKDYVGAIALCDQHIAKKTRDSSWCLKIKADLLYKIGEYSKARKIYQSVADDREAGWAMLGLGRTLTALEQYSEASECLLQLIKKNPLSLEAYDSLANNHQQSGDTESAQETLKKALSICSRSILRQQTFAEICTQNEDLETASIAFRITINLSRNSVRRCADNNLNLARCLSDYAAQSTPEEAKGMIDEALHTLTELTKEFENPELKVRSKLVEACVYHSIQNTKKAQAAITEASALKETLGIDDSAEVLLEFAKTYAHTNNKDKAKEILSILEENYSNDFAVTSAIDKMLDNPISKSGQIEIKGINTRGIGYYEAQEYDAAIDEFSRAITRFPNHVGLQLNLIQAILAILTTDSNTKYLRKCRVIMKKLEKIPEDHQQYKRYLKMRKKYEDILSKPTVEKISSDS